MRVEKITESSTGRFDVLLPVVGSISISNTVAASGRIMDLGGLCDRAKLVESSEQLRELKGNTETYFLGFFYDIFVKRLSIMPIRPYIRTVGTALGYGFGHSFPEL